MTKHDAHRGPPPSASTLDGTTPRSDVMSSRPGSAFETPREVVEEDEPVAMLKQKKSMSPPAQAEAKFRVLGDRRASLMRSMAAAKKIQRAVRAWLARTREREKEGLLAPPRSQVTMSEAAPVSKGGFKKRPQSLQLDDELVKVIARMVEEKITVELSKREGNTTAMTATAGATTIPIKTIHSPTLSPNTSRAQRGSRASPHRFSPVTTSAAANLTGRYVVGQGPSMAGEELESDKRAREVRERLALIRQAEADALQKLKEAAEQKSSITYKECRSAVYPPTGVQQEDIPRVRPGQRQPLKCTLGNLVYR